MRIVHHTALCIDYWKDDELTRDSFRNGWYFTKDKAYKDADNYLFFVGRSDDVFKASGYRIGPFEVESALVSHKAVAEAAVVPSPDATRGNVVKAFVVLRAGFQPSSNLIKQLQVSSESYTE
jgi:acyl-coenzyme A synthetase/AMP-(fatty) acid ligase